MDDESESGNPSGNPFADSCVNSTRGRVHFGGGTSPYQIHTIVLPHVRVCLWLGRITIGEAHVVQTPFIHIAAHVIQAQLVGLLQTHRKSPAVNGTALVVPGHFVRIVASRVFVAQALLTSSSSVFPLGLGGQADLTIYFQDLLQLPAWFIRLST